jgi:hypothetical protein
MTEAPPTTRQIACALRHFDEHNRNAPVDLTGTYGPQSTDLITLYIRDLLGEIDWQWTIGAAKYAIDSPRLREHFNLIAPDELRFGDIVCLYGTETSEFGTVGVFLRDHRNGDVEVFTQTPFNPSRRRFMRRAVQGGLRYKRNTPALTSQLVPAALAEPRATLAAWMMLGSPESRIQRFSVEGADDVNELEAWAADLEERLPAERGRRALVVELPHGTKHESAGRHYSKPSLWARLWQWGTR